MTAHFQLDHVSLTFRTPLAEGILTKVERTRRAKKLLFPDLNDDIHEGNELETNQLNIICYLKVKV